MDYDAGVDGHRRQRLTDFGADRLAGMDASGISVAILSHTVPGVQGIVDPATAVSAARDINDRLAAADRAGTRIGTPGLPASRFRTRRRPRRELDRAVTRLGFKGAMINGYTNTARSAARRVSRRAEVPPVLGGGGGARRPGLSPPAARARPADLQGHSELIGATWGFAPEAATHALRLVYSGLFDRFPTLTIVLGHLGETLPYFCLADPALLRIQPVRQAGRAAAAGLSLRQLLRVDERLLSDQALIGAMLTIGADRILFAVRLSLRDDGAGRALDRARGDQRGRSKENSRRQCRRLFKIAVTQNSKRKHSSSVFTCSHCLSFAFWF